jgi:hypothetical protein
VAFYALLPYYSTADQSVNLPPDHADPASWELSGGLLSLLSQQTGTADGEDL